MFPPRVCAAVTAVALVAAPGPARAATLSEDFDSGGAGWESTGLWGVVDRPETIGVSPAIAGVLTSVPAGSALPAAWSGTRAAWFGDPSTGTYCVGYAAVDQHPSDGCRSAGIVEGSLTSPPFALPGPAAVLRFRAWWEIAAGDFEASDLMTVDYSTDGGTTWTESTRLNPSGPPFGSVHQPYTSDGLRAAGVWRPYEADLTPALGAADVRVRFRFDSVGSLGQGFRGLLVDDVVVEGSELPSGGAGAGTGLAPGGSGQPAGVPGGPVLGSTLVIEPVSGRTTYRRPGVREPVLLDRATLVPFGTVVDTVRGTVRVIAAAANGATQSGTFHDGVFQLRQAPGGVIELALRGGRFPHCDDGCTSAVRRARTVRHLWGTAGGRFRTRGRYASGTVRGTEWLVADHLGDTLIRVRKGSALVRDFVRDRDVVVNAGQAYVARVVYTNRRRGNPRFGRQYILAVRDGRVVHVYRTSRIVLD
jgi:hypothetical protein